MSKFHTAGIFAALTSLAGLVVSPEFLNLVPARYAAGISIAGLILQAVTKGIQHGGTDLVPKDSK